MPAAHRIERSAFRTASARRVHSTNISLSIAKNINNKPLFGCVVSKKIAARATDRNALKRRCREAFRPELAWIGAWSIVVYPKKNALTIPFSEFKHEVKAVLARCF